MSNGLSRRGLKTTDVERARSSVDALFGATFTLAADPPAAFVYEMAAVTHPMASTAALRFGGSVRVGTQAFPDFIVAHAASGRHRWRIGSDTGDGRVPFIVPPGHDFRAQFERLHLRTLRVGGEALDQVLRAVLGADPPRLNLLALNERPRNPRLLAESLRFLEATAIADEEIASSSLMRMQLLHQAVAALVTVYPLVDTDALDLRRPTARTVRRAVSYMEENAHRSISVGDIALAAGTSVRALQSAFHRAYGIPPITYLRRIRLEGAHADLRAADAGSVTVREVALRWGFGHTGRFAQLYAEAYGEHPSHTLRR